MIANPIAGSWLSVSGAKLYLNGSDSAIWILDHFFVSPESPSELIPTAESWRNSRSEDRREILIPYPLFGGVLDK